MARITQGSLEPVRYPISYILYPDQTIPAVAGTGTCVNTTVVATTTTNAPSNIQGPGVRLETAAADTSVASIETPFVFSVTQSGKYKGRITFTGGTTDVRVWVVLTSGVAGDFAASDGPAKHYVGFRYSTVEGGADFNCVSKNAVTESLETTAVAFDTDTFTFEIDVIGDAILEQVDSITCRINNSIWETAYEKVWTIADNVPSGTEQLKLVVVVEAKGAAVRGMINHYHSLSPRN